MTQPLAGERDFVLHVRRSWHHPAEGGDRTATDWQVHGYATIVSVGSITDHCQIPRPVLGRAGQVGTMWRLPDTTRWAGFCSGRRRPTRHRPPHNVRTVSARVWGEHDAAGDWSHQPRLSRCGPRCVQPSRWLLADLSEGMPVNSTILYGISRNGCTVSQR
mgnify:CR=1 FL=1